MLASVRECEYQPTAWDVRFRMSPMSAVLCALAQTGASSALGREYLALLEQARPNYCQSSGPSCFLGQRGQPFFTSPLPSFQL